MTTATALPEFDFEAFAAAFDRLRKERGLGWYEFAGELWEQSADLNARLDDHPLCGGAVSRLPARGETSCQYALFLLRWLGTPPEDYLTGNVVDVGDTSLRDAGPDSRLRFELPELHAAMNDRRRERGLTWAQLADIIGCTPARLTNLRTAKQADLALTMRITQWVGRPAADFIHASTW